MRHARQSLLIFCVQMGSMTLSVVALTPTVECGTTSWWLWTIFYVLVLVLLLSILVYIVFATTKARDEKVSVSFSRARSAFDREEDKLYSPGSVSEKFGVLWREAFRDQVPWWTAMELLIRLALIAIFSLSITRIPTYTNFVLGLAILGFVLYTHFQLLHIFFNIFFSFLCVNSPMFLDGHIDG